MTIESEAGIESKSVEMLGKNYDSVEGLNQEIGESESKEIRIYGKKLINKGKSKISGKEYYNIKDVPDDPNAYFDATIYGVEDSDTPSAFFNVNAGGKFFFTIKPENIKDWWIEIL